MKHFSASCGLLELCTEVPKRNKIANDFLMKWNSSNLKAGLFVFCLIQNAHFSAVVKFLCQLSCSIIVDEAKTRYSNI